MLQTFIHRLLKRRHFWRYASFSEVSELYASRTMRLFALRIVSVFTSIYLYQNGYDLLFITLFWAIFYLLKVLAAWPSARIAASYGPKHGTLISNIISAAGIGLLTLIADPVYGIYALAGWCVMQAFSGSLNDLCYLIDFSKVKNVQHAGKEIGYMNIFEKVSTGLSPVIGGVIALWFGPEVVMLLSGLLFLLSAIPLLQTAEPTLTHRKLNFVGFPWKTTWRSFVANSAVGFDVYTTGTVWSLFIAITVFATTAGSDKVYAQVGLVTSVTIFVALLSSYTFGKIIDQRKGRELLLYGTIANSLAHISRIFVTTPLTVVYTNIFNEAATTGFSMAFLRGMFDTADMSGKRIEYMFIIEMVVNFGAGIAALLFALCLVLLPPLLAMQVFFVVTAVVTLLIATPKFALYKH